MKSGELPRSPASSNRDRIRSASRWRGRRGPPPPADQSRPRHSDSPRSCRQPDGRLEEDGRRAPAGTLRVPGPTFARQQPSYLRPLLRRARRRSRRGERRRRPSSVRMDSEFPYGCGGHTLNVVGAVQDGRWLSASTEKDASKPPITRWYEIGQTIDPSSATS